MLDTTTNPADRRDAVAAVARTMALLYNVEPVEALVLVAGTMLAPLLKRLPPHDREGTLNALLLLANVPIPPGDA